MMGTSFGAALLLLATVTNATNTVKNPPPLHPAKPLSAEQAARLSTAYSDRLAKVASYAQQDQNGVSVPFVRYGIEGNYDIYSGLAFGDSRVLFNNFMIDSGASCVIHPDYRALAQADPSVRILVANTTEPWGSLAHIVVGDIHIPLGGQTYYRVPNAVFYACVETNRGCFANFGTSVLGRYDNTHPKKVRSLFDPQMYTEWGMIVEDLHRNLVFDYSVDAMLLSDATPEEQPEFQWGPVAKEIDAMCWTGVYVSDLREPGVWSNLR